MKHLARPFAVFVEKSPGLGLLANIASSIGVSPLALLKADADMFSSSLRRQEDLAVLGLIAAAQSIPGIEIPPVRSGNCGHCEARDHGEAHDEENDPSPDCFV